MLHQRPNVQLGRGGSTSSRTGASSQTPVAPRHASVQLLTVCAASVPKKNNYYDFDKEPGFGQNDNFDYYPGGTQQQGAATTTDFGAYTADLWQSTGRGGAAVVAPGARYPAQQPRYSAQRAPVYLSNSSLDDMEDDYDYPEDPVEVQDNSNSAARTVNGRQLLINNEIQAQVVRVIAGEGGRVMKGVMSYQDAMSLAQGAQVDLVLLNPDAQPPLCRLVVWSKYKYEIEKDQKKKAVKAVTVETKEVRLRPSTDVGDLQTKIRSAQKFLDKGNKLKLVMKFEGRELQYKEQGKAVMLKFVDELGVLGKVDGPINFKTGTYTAMISPTGRTLKDLSLQSPPAPDDAAQAAAAPPTALPPAVPPPLHSALPLPPAPPATAQQLPLPPAPAARQPPPPPAGARPALSGQQQLPMPPAPARMPLPPRNAPPPMPGSAPMRPPPPLPVANPGGAPLPRPGPPPLQQPGRGPPPPLPPPVQRPGQQGMPMGRPNAPPPLSPSPMGRPGLQQPMQRPAPLGPPPGPNRQAVPASGNKK